MTTSPAVEPLTLSEAKSHLRVDTTDEDILISSLITAARVHIEAATGRALITQVWSLYLDTWPAGNAVPLPLAPLVSVDAVRTYDVQGVATTLNAQDYFVDTVSQVPRVVRVNGQIWSPPGQVANGVEIAFTAGYGIATSDVPEPLRQAVRLLVAHWFETREPVVLGAQADMVPTTVDALAAPYRRVRL
ncbi:MAG: head-tail connector protein [Alphaproteobacteria bacterium]